MKRFLSTSNLYIGQLVVCSDAPDAVVRTISGIHNRNGINVSVTVMWSEGIRICSQTLDSYLLHTPTVKQIEMSINTYGNLVTQQLALDASAWETTAEVFYQDN